MLSTFLSEQVQSGYESISLKKSRVNYKGSYRKLHQKNNFDEKELLNYLRVELGEEVFNYVNTQIDLESEYVRSMYLVSPFNVATLPFKSYKGLVNICRLNSNKRINDTLETVNEKLEIGGLYIGCVETYQTRKIKHKRKYKMALPLVHFIDFIYHRVFAKLSWTRKFYLKITKANKRVMSKTETFGRVIRAGFGIVDYKIMDDLVWFVAKKEKAPDKRPAPDYGMFYKKRCIGKNGNEIGIYKLRTMHPYAEYMQSYLIHKNGYSCNSDGKIKNDYRVTKWGKLMRKLYIDEMPQFLNVFKGDMALIGVRPVTAARLEQFPKDLIQARQAFKPGCIPPYVSLRMGDENGNLEAEWIYIKAKEKQGLITDLRFFVLAVYNIISGKMWSA